jgi:hypothetical protein
MSEHEQGIGQVCIQVHPDRAPTLNVTRLSEECEAIAKQTKSIRGIGITEGEDDGKYLNIVFVTENPIESWRKLKEALLESTEFGSSLKASCLCMCTGKTGWDDYLLLYHFDPEALLDEAGDA